MKLVGEWSYSLDYDPPAPVIKAKLLAPRQKEVEIPAFIDSGADLTVVSEKAAKQSSLTENPPIGVVFVESPDYAGLAPLYHVEIVIKRVKLKTIICVAPITEEAVFGRNLLNKLTTTLNGPSEITSIYVGAASIPRRT